MLNLEPGSHELVEPVQAVAGRISDRRAQRLPAQRRVAEEDERTRLGTRAGLGHVG